ncbi:MULTISPECIES: NepR family anti-sigma factor [Paracoccaceae]|jgi:hypothetical protein|uniref:NepR family anti-sigma factor n=1 Tax=Rhodobacterales TaxID=204455 RepID=UPI0013144B20|nr:MULTISPECIES: NepR family anti-sigma factor [Paracoccaceae]MBO6602671.1 hypothetical protein [Roseicyclus sp.]MBO6623726.1 hypothetical protein [Roseicyclus sp.]MBO6922821.1 hypothetical protein [Roseicyclus sp.]
MSSKQPDPKTRQQIDENLKRVFEHQLQEELPDRFKDLLSQLKAQDAAKGQGSKK